MKQAGVDAITAEKTILKNLKILRSAGYPFKYMLKYANILLLEESEIARRLDILQTLKLNKKVNWHVHLAGLQEEEREEVLKSKKPGLKKLTENYKTFVKPSTIVLKNHMLPSQSHNEVMSVKDWQKLASLGNITNLKRKFQFFKSKGFSDKDIYNHVVIFYHSLKMINAAYNELERNHIEEITLNTLYAFIRTKKLQRYKFNKITLTQLFKWNINEVELSSEVRRSLSSQGLMAIEVNYKYLKSEGFSDRQLCKLPAVLAHNPKVLSRHWTFLKTNVHLLLWDKEDKLKTLNLLQYHLEKENNFRPNDSEDIKDWSEH